MQAGLVVLALGYVLSQFYRSFLSVLSIPLERDIGATPQDLADASGLWFLSFALMQIPVGWALDRIGPRLTAGTLLLLGGGIGAVLFGLANSPGQVRWAMSLIGIGCSPVLMASYYIFARAYPPRRFATLAALFLGIGSLGNLVAARPMAAAVEFAGWRAAMFGLAAVTVVAGIGILLTLRDPERVERSQSGSVLTLLRIPALWLILPLMFIAYVPAASIRGVWIGPFLDNLYGLDTLEIGTATLVMGACMIAGTFAYGPLDRVFGTRKWVIVGGNTLALSALVALAAWPMTGIVAAVTLMAAVGFFGASFPVMVAHGRAFFPKHLVGRGVTLLNLFGIGGVGVMNFATGEIFALTPAAMTPAMPFVAVFSALAIVLAIGIFLYLFTTDRVD